jgi:hypothetical protein
MRKGFNFYRSYYDVANELNKEDRLKFLWALIQKQFDGTDTELSGMAKFAYLSQKFNIDTQVAGYENKTKTKITPMQGGAVGGAVGGSVQEKEKEKEQIIKAVACEFDLFWNIYNKKRDKEKCLKAWSKIDIKEIPKILESAKIYVKSNTDIQYRKNPFTWLNGKCWNDEISAPEEKIVYAFHNIIYD